jgi:alpha/beta superfamily hydrolase
MARELAMHGFDAVRLDLGGIGESPSAFRFDENRSYPVLGTSDVASAMRWIRRELQPSKCIVYGLCAGAYHAIVVTNEVGMGIVPETPLGRTFRDLCGRAHQAISARADEVYFGAMGSLIRLKPGPLAVVTAEEEGR